MSHKNIHPLLFAAILFAACNNGSKEQKINTNYSDKLIMPTIPVSPTVQQPVQTQTQTQIQTQSQPNTTIISQPDVSVIQPVIPVTPVTSVNPVTTTTGAGLNPEHGKPGHRCDIAVGAPLNSKPITPTVATSPTNNNPVTINSTSPVEIQKTVSSAQTNGLTTTAGLNPEHGKPGHRCDIAVGAPLDSKPAATPAITTVPANNTPVTPTISQPVTPILPAGTNTTPVTVASGLNPEHGKPGHRCDIAVGAPLNSKPVETKKENN